MEENKQVDDLEGVMEEEKRRMEADFRAEEIAWEKECAEEYGPPEERARRNQEYVDALVRQCSEADLRAMLRALAEEPGLRCRIHLEPPHDLTNDPLAEIIAPFQTFGLHFEILSIDGPDLEVSIAASHGRLGGGGKFVLRRGEDGTFEVVDWGARWTC